MSHLVSIVLKGTILVCSSGSGNPNLSTMVRFIHNSCSQGGWQARGQLNSCLWIPGLPLDLLGSERCGLPFAQLPSPPRAYQLWDWVPALLSFDKWKEEQHPQPPPPVAPEAAVVTGRTGVNGESSREAVAPTTPLEH